MESLKTLKGLLSINLSGQEKIGWYIRNGGKQPANQEYYIQQISPLKNEEEIKIFPHKQKLREFATARPALLEV